MICAALAARSDSALAASTVRGVPGWLAPAAERAIDAVSENIDRDAPRETRLELIKVVSERLFRGYSVAEVDTSAEGGAPIVVLAARSVPQWSVEISPPPMTSPAAEWFAHDAWEIDARVLELLDGVPDEALLWGSEELRASVADICRDPLPGWEPSLMLATADGSPRLIVALAPMAPLTLAVEPDISSTTIPYMLHSRMKGDLIKGSASVIGMPVVWMERHMEDFAQHVRAIIADEYLIDKGSARSTVSIEPDAVSRMDIEVESSRYRAEVWLAVYAGSRGRIPEAGVHFGRRVVPFSGWDLELYGELIAQIDDFSLEGRLGLGWDIYRDVWLGAEWSSMDDLWWARMVIRSPHVHRPYVWARISEKGDKNAGAGVRVTGYLSLELVYDSRDQDNWNIRAVINL